jgi:hypothetical protein
MDPIGPTGGFVDKLAELGSIQRGGGAILISPLEGEADRRALRAIINSNTSDAVGEPDLATAHRRG